MRTGICAILLVLFCAGRSMAAPSFEDIIAPSQRTHEASCALMQAWVEAHPGDPRTPRGLVWMAQLHVADHQQERARPIFLRVYHEYPGTEWAQHGLKGLAYLDLQSRRYAEAIARYESLAHGKDPFFQYVGAMSAQSARQARLRYFVTLGLGVGFVLLWALRLWRLPSWRSLWPPPVEVVYPLPILVLSAVASGSASEGEGRGVLWLSLCAPLVLWLNGAYLRARPPTGAWRFVHGALGIAQAAALLYVAVVMTGLWDKFHDTLEMGAD